MLLISPDPGGSVLKSLVRLSALITMLFWLYGSHAAGEDTVPAYTGVFRVLLLSPPTTLDPQASSLSGDHGFSQYFFDPLFTLQDGKAVPVLVESYHWETPTRWRFVLKKGVLFHDGSELTTSDVTATFRRAFRLRNNAYEHIKDYDIQALDTYQFQIDTRTPNSELLWDLEDVRVISHTAENADSAAFDSGEQLVGTGPYRLVRRQGFEQFELTAFMDYHRGPAFIRNVQVRSETDPERRRTAFLAGQTDLTEGVFHKYLPELQHEASVTNKTSHFLYMLAPDAIREQSPDVLGPDGKPLPHNPLKDLRVRQAISLALDRDRLVNQLLGSQTGSQPAGQLVNNNTEMADPTLFPDQQDIPAAKRLLREAGYPKGFHLIIRDKDARREYLERIADMLGEVGIQARIATLPAGEYFRKANSQAFSAAFFAYSADGNLANLLTQLLYTGAAGNKGGYSNPTLDRQIDHALAQTSAELKRRELRKAQRLAIKDLALIPILFQAYNWVIRPDMIYLPTDQFFTEAYYVRPNTPNPQ
ncbi:MAG: hypothetical protein KDI44_00515 [Thiothrix sp.]|nr:hypothetical protein [Thiothrix sp.]HPQ95199.1 ABC transporter substrate-binding protein [Thiolinea sp.]